MTLLVFAVICLFKIGNLNAETGRRDADSSGDLNQNYFFYQQSEYPRDCYEVLQGCSLSNASGVYVIKPDGFPQPFEVYCDNDVSLGGWTVVQRRKDNFVKFDRPWESYKDGFGFLAHEFWLGLEKLSHLTNQGSYKLRVDLQLSNGSSFYVTYDVFRINDEWSKYAVVSLGEYNSYGDDAITSCPRNMIHGTCTCPGTCDEPNGSTDCQIDCLGAEGCYCPDGFLINGDECVPPSECPCFWSEIDQVIPNGQTKVNDNCTERRNCTKGQLVYDGEHRCSSDAQCTLRDGVRQCYCNDGYQGDGQNCDVIYTDCYDAYDTGNQREDGVYLIKPIDWPGPAFNVSCVMSTHEGGWTVFQRRIDHQTDFYRNWTSYKDGFGSFNGDFWLGNEKLYYLTHQKSNKLRVDMLGSSNSAMYVEYSTFSIGTEEDKYRLTATGYSGNTGYGYLQYYNNGKAFSTYDQDNDACGRHNFAERIRSGWWYDIYHCTVDFGPHCTCFEYGSRTSWGTYTNANGDYNGGNGENIFWYSQSHSDFCNLNFIEMKIRPSS